MPVKPSQSASRALAVLEAIATRQPIGVSALARVMDEDRSAVQRAVITLSEAGWIRVAPETPARWELSARFFTAAHLPDSGAHLRQRARRVLDELRDETGETAFLAIPDVDRFVVIEVAESPHLLRLSPRLGELIPPQESATGRALLPYLDGERRAAMLGRVPDAAELAEFAATRARGFSLSAGDVLPGATNLAAPVFDGRGQPVGAVGVSGPSDRLSTDRYAGVGVALARGAASLSRRAPA